MNAAGLWKLQFNRAQSRISATNACKKRSSSNLQGCFWPTWRHCTPAETPPLPCNTMVCMEQDIDDICPAWDIGWQGDTTGHPHQGCPVAVRDCHPVCIFLSREVGELQCDHQSLLHLYFVRHPQMIRILSRVIWRCDNTWGKESFKFQWSIGSVGASATHLCCHSHLQDKVVSTARVHSQWLSQRHKRKTFHTGRSSTHHWGTGSPRLQGQNRVDQQWAGGEKGRLILKRHLVIFSFWSVCFIILEPTFGS